MRDIYYELRLAFYLPEWLLKHLLICLVSNYISEVFCVPIKVTAKNAFLSIKHYSSVLDVSCSIQSQCLFLTLADPCSFSQAWSQYTATLVCRTGWKGKAILFIPVVCCPWWLPWVSPVSVWLRLWIFWMSEAARIRFSLYMQFETDFCYIFLVSANPMPEATYRKGNVQYIAIFSTHCQKFRL